MRVIGKAVVLLGLIGASSVGLAESVTAPSTGLGQSWPNATDVSTSVRYHVYRFERAGIRYVQVNDLGGAVRGAVASAGSDIFSLPVGTDASRWITPTEGAWTDTAMRGGEPVYQDGTMTVTAAPQSDGSVRLMAAPGDCNGNPAECSVPRQ